MERGVDFGFGGVAAEAEADAAAGFRGGKADGGQDVRGLDGARGACCACGAGQALQIERDDQRFPFETGKSDVAGVWGARGIGGVCVRIRHAREQTLFESVAKRGNAGAILLSAMSRKFGGFAQPDNAGHIFCAGAESALVMSTIKQLFQARAALDVDCADSFGGVNLVCRKAPGDPA